MLSCERVTRAAFLLLAAVLAVEAQFSPGPLSKAHQSLEGPTRCIQCHALGGGREKLKCLECHGEIRQRLAARQGWHGRLAGQRANGCASCHGEHNGEQFVPTRWDAGKREFDHRQTGYTLEERHAGVACRRCHRAERVVPAERRTIRMRDLRRTWLGLSRECLGCHQDVHAGQLGARCEQCHSFAGWKPAERFDHARAKFRLTGGHSSVACDKCHLEAGGRERKYVALAFDNCASCHRDPHGGSFRSDCRRCHAARGWRPARLDPEFDHSRTPYALASRHAELRCAACHRGGNFKRPVAHARCGDCHVKDPHNGRFQARAANSDCGACHTVESWNRASYALLQPQLNQDQYRR